MPAHNLPPDEFRAFLFLNHGFGERILRNEVYAFKINEIYSVYNSCNSYQRYQTHVNTGKEYLLGKRWNAKEEVDGYTYILYTNFP